MKLLARRASILAFAALIVPACGGGGGGGGTAAPSNPTSVVTSVGGMQILARGGQGTAGAGGAGGAVSITAQSGSDLNVLTGALGVDSSFTVPAGISFDAAQLGSSAPAGFGFGANVRTISADTIITPPAVGPFVIPGDNAAADATGLYVAPGVTLTINGDGGAAGLTAHLNFTDGILIAGTIQMATVTGTNNSANLNLQCSQFNMAVGSSFLAKGLDGTGGIPAGGNGGTLRVDGSATLGNDFLGTVTLQGTIDTSGGSTTQAASAGAGGSFIFNIDGSYYSTGPMTSNGGTATLGAASTAGGNAGSFSIVNGSGGFFGVIAQGVHSSSAFSLVGGDGRTGAGSGGAANFSASNNNFSILQLGGSIATSGGATTVSGNGGAGGAINLSNTGYHIAVSTTITSTGGNSTGGTGGSGGSLTINSTNSQGAALGTGSNIVSGGLSFSANVTLNGGTGSVGGAAGSLTIMEDQNSASAAVNPVNIVGFALIDTTGGAGTTAGAAGGAVTIGQLVHTDNTGAFTQGSILNSVPLTTSGGDATAGSAGAGGVVTIGTQTAVALGPIPPTTAARENGASLTRTVSNTAAITSWGGNGSVNGGPAGAVQLQDFFGALNSGALTLTGGTGGSGFGGAGAQLLVQSNNEAKNSGAVLADGGNGAAGGAGGGIRVTTTFDVANSAPTATALNTVTGTLSASGGAGSGGNGGPGGTLLVQGNNVARNDAPVTVNGGSGSVAGSNGGTLTVTTAVVPASSTPTASALNSLTGALSAVGGTGGTGNGGNGGFLSIQGTNIAQNDAPVTVNGGNGAAAGGSGGSLNVSTASSPANSTLTSSAANTAGGTLAASGGTGGTGNGGNGGALNISGNNLTVNHAAVTVDGGDGTSGGAGGSLNISTILVHYNAQAGGANTGDLHANGGNGSNTGGGGGVIRILVHAVGSNTGNVIANGGNGGTGGGGNANFLFCGADGTFTDSATYQISGGSSTTGNGGNGGTHNFQGEYLTRVGNITANGGNGVIGGSGGELLEGSTVGPTVFHGTMSVVPGTGGTPAVGLVNVDGVSLPLVNGVGTY